MVNYFECPHCKRLHDGFDYIDPVEMEGEFSVDCEECEKEFLVRFETSIEFTTME